MIASAFSSRRLQADSVRTATWFGVVAWLPLAFNWAAVSCGEDAPEKAKTPLGQFITVSSPVDDAVFARVTNAAIKLQNQSAQDGRPAILVLQIEPGTSQFHHVQGWRNSSRRHRSRT